MHVLSHSRLRVAYIDEAEGEKDQTKDQDQSSKKFKKIIRPNKKGKITMEEGFQVNSVGLRDWGEYMSDNGKSGLPGAELVDLGLVCIGKLLYGYEWVDEFFQPHPPFNLTSPHLLPRHRSSKELLRSVI